MMIRISGNLSSLPWRETSLGQADQLWGGGGGQRHSRAPEKKMSAPLLANWTH
jgi:hypothetical protein